MPEFVWRQIAEELEAKIDSGELAPGSQLPTELELRDQYNASRNTVRDAVKWLITRAKVETRPGQGTFVVEKMDPFVTVVSEETGFGGHEGAAYASEVMARSRVSRETQPRIEIYQAAEALAPELHLSESDQVLSRHQLRFIDEVPWSMQTSFYPMSLVNQGALNLIRAEDIPGGAVDYIEQVTEVKRAGTRDVIMVRAPHRAEAEFFKLSDDGRVAVFETRRTSFDQAGNPYVLTVTTYPADRNLFVMSVGQVPDDAPVPTGS